MNYRISNVLSMCFIIMAAQQKMQASCVDYTCFTLKNTLKGLCDINQMNAAGIDPGKRPQELDVGDYINLFRQLY